MGMENPVISTEKWPPRSASTGTSSFLYIRAKPRTAILGWLRRWLSLFQLRRIQRDRGANTVLKTAARTVNLHYRATGKQHGVRQMHLCVVAPKEACPLDWRTR